MMREYAAKFFAVFLLRKECSFNEIFSELLALVFSEVKRIEEKSILNTLA